MTAIEFHAQIREGMIAIPREYKDQFTDGVRVILMTEAPQDAPQTLLDDLLDHPLEISGFRPLARDDAHAR